METHVIITTQLAGGPTLLQNPNLLFQGAYWSYQAFYEELSQPVEYLHCRAGAAVSTRTRQARLGASGV
jgi:hypothetical protein